MRIAHVITRLILGGAQENTLLCCEDLMRIYGDEVLLVSGPPRGPEGSLLERARAGGVRLELIDCLRRPIHPYRDLASYAKLRRVLHDFRPDVVHTHSAKGGMLGRAAASALGIPVIVHGVHGAPFHPYQSRLARALSRACEQWGAGKCDAFISVADAMTNLMVEAGVAPRKMFTTIYSGMEVEPLLEADRHRQRVRGQLGYGTQHVVIGKIARLFHLKGHEDVIRAAGLVVQQAPHTRFLLVGDGILRDRLQRQISAAGLADHFQLVGLVPPAEIPAYIGAMDILVHASLREGLARALPQALIAGKPVVSCDVDGAREVVIPGTTGYLVPPQNPNQLAAALLKLAEDASLRQRLGAEGRRRFRDVFRHERMTDQVRALYEELLARKR